MFHRLRAWLREQRQWKRDHVEAWPGWAEDSLDSLSRLQVECEAALTSALAAVGVQLVQREAREAEAWLYVHAVLEPTQLELWLHPDSVSILGPGVDWRLEEWDARTPAEFVARTVARALELVREHAEEVP